MINIFYFEQKKGISNNSLKLLSYAYVSIKSKELDYSKVAYGPYGKPFLKDDDFYFNISHSGKWLVCAVYDEEIGIDIQQLNYNKLGLFEELYQKVELIDKLDYHKLVYCTAIWTIKESYFKLVGTGIDDSLNKITVLSINPTILKCSNHIIKDIFFHTFLFDEMHIITIAINENFNEKSKRIYFFKVRSLDGK